LKAQQIEREKYEAKLRAENEAKQKAINEKLKAERLEKERIQAELKKRDDAEKERIRLIKESELKASLAGDKEKMQIWLDSISVSKPDVSKFERIESIERANEIFSKFEAFKIWAKKQIETL